MQSMKPMQSRKKRCWNGRLRLFVGFLSLCGISLATAEDIDQFVVTEAVGQNYHVEQHLDVRHKLNLEDGESIVLMDTRGQMYTLNGPLQEQLGEVTLVEDQGLVGRILTAFRVLFGAGEEFDEVLGAIRGDEEQAGPMSVLPNPWVLDVSQSGNHCVTEGASHLTLYRGKETNADTWILTEVVSAAKTDVTWESGVLHRLEKPEFLQSDALLLLREQSAHVSVAVQLRPVPAGLEELQNPAALAYWLASAGCDSQARAALAAVEA